MLQSKCKRRSSLRKVVAADKDEAVDGDEIPTAGNRNSMIKRRISFSGKKFVREFNNTEKPHEWDNSYELSDHTNGEESGALETGAKSAVKVVSLVSAQDKENVPLTSFQVDSTFNLQTSIDITLLPSELKRSAGTGAVISRAAESPRKSLTSSLFLSPTKRDQLKSQTFKYPMLDKTVDLFPDSVMPSQKQKDQMLAVQPSSKDSLTATSNLDITKPLSMTHRVASVDTSPVSHLPGQNSLLPMSQMQKKSSIWDTSMDISFNMHLSKNDMALDSLHSSPLIPMDMISFQGISGPMNLRQLNEAIEAGNIRVCPDGPKTPTTDRKAKYQRFWKGVEQENVEHVTHRDSIRKIKPGIALNFNESNMISPPASAPAPVVDYSVPEDKRKYRYSQADEMLLNNTNFLAHARLGDETQSRNSSRHAESTYVANSNSKLDQEHAIHFDESLGQKVSRLGRNINVEEMKMPEYLQKQKIQKSASNRRQTLLMEESMEQQQSPIIDEPKERQIHVTTKSLYLNESIEEDIGLSDDILRKNVASYPFKSKARNTLLLAEPIEEDVGISGHLSSARPVAKHELYNAKSTLLMTEAIKDDMAATHKDLAAVCITENAKFKSRNTLLLTEPIEEDLMTPREDEPEVPLSKYKRSKARNTLLMTEDIEEDIVAPREDLPLCETLKSKPRSTILLSEPIEQNEGTSGKVSSVGFIANKERSMARSTLVMSEPVEDDGKAFRKDLNAIPAMENPQFKTRKTLLLTEPIQEDLRLPNQDEPAVPLSKHKRSKARNTLLMSEDIEEDIVAPREDLPHAPLCETLKSKPRSTILLSEPIEQNEGTSGKVSSVGFIANKERSMARSTLIMSEPVEDDGKAFRKDLHAIPAMENPQSKTRKTLLLTEPIQEDLRLPNQDEPAVPLSKCKRSKARNTLLMTEDIEEDIVASREDLPLCETLKSKPRSTILLSEPIEQNEGTFGKVSSVGHIANKEISKARSTLVMSEPVEDDGKAFRKDLSAIPAMENPQSKTRKTLLLTEPIEEDLRLPNQDEPAVPLSKHKRSKARNTLLMSEDIEEDIVGPRGDFLRAPVCEGFSSKATLLLGESVERDVGITGKLNVADPKANHNRSKTRNTFATIEPMEEDIVFSHSNLPNVPASKSFKYRSRNTLLLSEPMEEDLMTPYQNLPESQFTKHKRSNARSTLLMAEKIEEDKVPVNLSIDMASKSKILPLEPDTPLTIRDNRTVHRIEPSMVNEDGITMGENLPKVLSSKQQNSKARHTLLLAERIKEDTPVATRKGCSGVQAFNDDENTINLDLSEFHLHGKRSVVLREPLEDAVVPRQNLQCFSSVEEQTASRRMLKNVAEIITREEDNFKMERTPTTAGNLKEIDQQQDMDLDLVATPQNKPKRICNHIAMTPFRSPVEFEDCRSLIEFEDEETALKSPKQASYGIGTPLARVKRSHKQLTPNLPQSKKHHGLFHDHIETMQEQMFDVDETVQVLRDGKRNQNHYKDKPSISMFEDKCITISDVSNYFEIRRKEEDCEENEDGTEEQQQQPRMQAQNESLELEIVSGGIQTYSKFINITGDTIVIPLMDESSGQEIDEVRLSLVSNLIEEDVDKNDREVCLEKTLDQPVEAGTSSSCRKCHNCRRSLSNTIMSNGSFSLSPFKKWDITRDLERLELVRRRPHFMDIQKYFHLKEQEIRHSTCMEEEPATAEQTQLEDLSFNHITKFPEIMQLFQTLAQRRKLPEETVHRDESLQSLDLRLATEQPQWTFDHQLRVSRKLLFAHRQFSQIFRIVMTYDSLDDIDMGIRISSIYIEPTCPPTSWLPFDHVLNYQLGLKLPVKLMDCLEGHDVESVAKFLQHINKICIDIKSRARRMAKAITSSISTLIRQQHRTVVKKTSHIISPIGANGILQIQEIEFVIEITNLEEISFKDIVQPQLYMFEENIQYLPRGVAFLEAFLPNPEQYLKQTCNQ